MRLPRFRQRSSGHAHAAEARKSIGSAALRFQFSRQCQGPLVRALGAGELSLLLERVRHVVERLLNVALVPHVLEHGQRLAIRSQGPGQIPLIVQYACDAGRRQHFVALVAGLTKDGKRPFISRLCP